MKDGAVPPQLALRPPSNVMRLSRLGSMFPTRLSFLRVLTRRLASDGTAPKRTLWEIDAQGYGRAVYSLRYCGSTYSLVALSRPLADKDRSDRVIATAWDAAFVLYDGVPDADELDRICAAAPMQEAGRFTERDLVLSRANKSVRLWQHVVGALKAGQQPSAKMLNDIGYLMRTTAVYGNGKFGIADRAKFASRAGLEISFMAEMLTVWLIRNFTHDLVEHVGGGVLDTELKRHLGIGNATGLGMAPFLVTHPILLNNWMMVRETALARVRALPTVSKSQAGQIISLCTRAAQHLQEWTVPDPAYQARIDRLKSDFARVSKRLTLVTLQNAHPIETLWHELSHGSEDLQELFVSLLLEPFGDIVDGLAECLTDPFGGTGRPFGTTDEIRETLREHADWALETDYADPDACAKFWYVSEEKQEPRLGLRHSEPGGDQESPLDIARRIAALAADLEHTCEPVAQFLVKHPHHLMAVERLQILRDHPYSEIRDNLIGAHCLPIDMLRAKLSLFGATKFDPKSDLWTRITLAQGAPLACELDDPARQNWWLPTAPADPVSA